ncbi:MAG: hypothetical protein WC506_05030 [Candidatus Micrarchaeia archaeon]
MTDATEIRQVVDAWADVLGSNLSVLHLKSYSDAYASLPYARDMARSLYRFVGFENSKTITWLLGASEKEQEGMVRKFLSQGRNPNDFAFYMEAIQKTKEQFDLAGLFATHLERTHVTLDRFQSERVAALFSKYLSDDNSSLEEFLDFNEVVQYNRSAQFLTGHHLPLVDKYKFHEAVCKAANDFDGRIKIKSARLGAEEQEARDILMRELTVRVASERETFFAYLESQKMTANDFVWKQPSYRQKAIVEAFLLDCSIPYYSLSHHAYTYENAIRAAKEKTLEARGGKVWGRALKIFQDVLPGHLKDLSGKFIAYMAKDGKTFSDLDELSRNQMIEYIDKFLDIIDVRDTGTSMWLASAVDKTAQRLGIDSSKPIDLYATSEEPSTGRDETMAGIAVNAANSEKTEKQVPELPTVFDAGEDKATSAGGRYIKFEQALTGGYFDKGWAEQAAVKFMSYLKQKFPAGSVSEAFDMFFALKTDLDRWKIVQDFRMDKKGYDSSVHNQIYNALSSLKAPAGDRSKEITTAVQEKAKTDLTDINNQIRKGALKDLGIKYSPSRNRG